MKTKLQSDGTIMPRSSAAVGCAVATFDFAYNLKKRNLSNLPQAQFYPIIEQENNIPDSINNIPDKKN